MSEITGDAGRKGCYNRDDKCYDRSPGGLKLTSILLKKCGVRNGQSVLDLGCGYGESVSYISSAFSKNVVGVDRDQKKVEAARALYPECRFICGDAGELPFDTDAFDLVLAECVFSVFYQPDQVLEEVVRVLKPGGRLMLSDITNKAGMSFRCSGPVLGEVRPAAWYVDLLCRKGFSILHQEDGSEYVKARFAQMIFDYGLEKAATLLGCDCDKIREIGYTLVIGEL